MKLGYARVSTTDQDLAIQRTRLHEAGCEKLFEEKNAGLQSIAEPWADTTTPAGRMVLTVFAGIAEFERSLIAARTEEGRRATRNRSAKP